MVVLLLAIPLTVYYSQQQQDTRSRATAATTISLCATSLTPSTNCTATISTQAGQPFGLDVMMNPGSNTVTFLKLIITYDPTLLATASAQALVPNSAAVSSFGSPVFTPGTITVSFGIVANPAEVNPNLAIQTGTKIATINFTGLAVTPGTKVDFGATAQALSSSTADGQGENVLASKNPATITITASTIPTVTPTSGAQAANQPPVCTALNMDRANSGTAPYSLTFTAVGSDKDGNIQKITFNFGDGPVQDLTQAGGIGTNSVSSQVAHTYSNPGTYSASAVLTDNQSAVSSSSACLQTITVAKGTTGGGTNASGSAGPIVTAATPTPTPAILVAKPTIDKPGPGGNTLLNIGAIGAVMSIVGAVLFFAL